MKDFKSSQLIELRKISKQLYEAFDSALAYRSSLLEHVGTTEYEMQKKAALSDPETYYHFKLFDKGVSIIRLYHKSQWDRIEDVNDFHFAIKTFDFDPKFNISHRVSGNNNHIYGDFSSIDACIKYFITACVLLVDNVYNIIDPLFKEEYVLVK